MEIKSRVNLPAEDEKIMDLPKPVKKPTSAKSFYVLEKFSHFESEKI